MIVLRLACPTSEGEQHLPSGGGASRLLSSRFSEAEVNHCSRLGLEEVEFLFFVEFDRNRFE